MFFVTLWGELMHYIVLVLGPGWEGRHFITRTRLFVYFILAQIAFLLKKILLAKEIENSMAAKISLRKPGCKKPVFNVAKCFLSMLKRPSVPAHYYQH